MRLALALGQPNVDAMLDGMSARQWAEWVAYYRIEPFGQDRGDIPAAVVAAQVANAMPGRKKAVDPNEYLPMVGGREKQRQTPEQIKAVGMALAETLRKYRKKRG